MNNLFAYTGTTPENGYVPYINVSETNGDLYVTVRSSDNIPSIVVIPPEYIKALIRALADHAREVGALSPNIECKIVFDGSSMADFFNSGDGVTALRKALCNGQGGGQ